jgi:hypothetical protein
MPHLDNSLNTGIIKHEMLNFKNAIFKSIKIAFNLLVI